LVLVACGKPSEQAKPAFKQSEYAKNPNGDCVAHPTNYYDERAASKNGLQELTFLACQYRTRSDYHASQLDKVGKNERDVHLQIALRCSREFLAAMEAMQRVGVTDYNCNAL